MLWATARGKHGSQMAEALAARFAWECSSRPQRYKAGMAGLGWQGAARVKASVGHGEKSKVSIRVVTAVGDKSER